MPPVNIYYRDSAYEQRLEMISEPLRDHVAEQLGCNDLPLTRDEVSVRIIKCLGTGMLADVEMDIFAAPMEERVENQDEISSNVRDFMLKQLPDLSDAKVWLNLHELGYSFDR